MKALIVIVAASLALLSACTLQGNAVLEVDEHGCSPVQGYAWCEALGKCIYTWEDYCPKEGESTKLMTADLCLTEGGLPIDYGSGKRCSADQKVIGEVAGLVSLHVCCYPRPDDWEDY